MNFMVKPKEKIQIQIVTWPPKNMIVHHKEYENEALGMIWSAKITKTILTCLKNLQRFVPETNTNKLKYTRFQVQDNRQLLRLAIE